MLDYIRINIVSGWEILHGQKTSRKSAVIFFPSLNFFAKVENTVLCFLLLSKNFSARKT
jgi:hypothetical protein